MKTAEQRAGSISFFSCPREVRPAFLSLPPLLLFLFILVLPNLLTKGLPSHNNGVRRVSPKRRRTKIPRGDPRDVAGQHLVGNSSAFLAGGCGSGRGCAPYKEKTSLWAQTPSKTVFCPLAPQGHGLHKMTLAVTT